MFFYWFLILKTIEGLLGWILGILICLLYSYKIKVRKEESGITLEWWWIINYVKNCNTSSFKSMHTFLTEIKKEDFSWTRINVCMCVSDHPAFGWADFDAVFSSLFETKEKVLGTLSDFKRMEALGENWKRFPFKKIVLLRVLRFFLTISILHNHRTNNWPYHLLPSQPLQQGPRPKPTLIPAVPERAFTGP